MNSKGQQKLLELKQAYSNPENPEAYSGIVKIHQLYNGALSVKQIKDFLNSKPAYITHKEVKKLKYVNPTFKYFKRYQFQMDLIDIRNVSKDNHGFNYILCCIDIWSRKGYARILKTKSKEEVLLKFQSILKEAQNFPMTLLVDKGTEFKNNLFLNWCENNNIKVYFPYTSDHAPFCERWQRTIQRKLYRYCAENDTLTFYHMVERVVKSYNNT